MEDANEVEKPSCQQRQVEKEHFYTSPLLNFYTQKKRLHNVPCFYWPISLILKEK